MACNDQIDSVWLVKNGDSGVAPPRQSDLAIVSSARLARRFGRSSKLAFSSFSLSHTRYLFDSYRPPRQDQTFKQTAPYDREIARGLEALTSKIISRGRRVKAPNSERLLWHGRTL